MLCKTFEPPVVCRFAGLRLQLEPSVSKSPFWGDGGEAEQLRVRVLCRGESTSGIWHHSFSPAAVTASSVVHSVLPLPWLGHHHLQKL